MVSNGVSNGVSSGARTQASTLRAIVEAVDDPELPHVTIGDLGVVGKVELLAANTVAVTLTPTYIGCPATEQIRADVEKALADAGYAAEVTFVLSPPWTTDAITPTGRTKLAAAGIAPPGPAGDGPAAIDLPVRCPRCGSHRTRLRAAFGSTACKSSHTCDACAEPFEAVKAL